MRATLLSVVYIQPALDPGDMIILAVDAAMQRGEGFAKQDDVTPRCRRLPLDARKPVF